MKLPLLLKSNFKTHQKWQTRLSIWMFRTLIWWFVALIVPKVGFDMVWFAIVPAGLSFIFWPAGLSIKKAGILRWVGLCIFSFTIFQGQNHLMHHELHLGFIAAGSVLTSIFVGSLTSYFST